MVFDIYSVCLLEQALHVMKPGFLGSEMSEIRMEEVTGRKVVVGCGKHAVYKWFVSQFIYSGQTGRNVEEFMSQVELTIKLTRSDGDKMQLKRRNNYFLFF